jgi:tRNA nucleotidyltransferase/poly(A) polymerase
MPDYMYLLESRLSPEQRAVLERVQELSRSQDVNIYLSGGAVRDLISGQPIRDLDFTVEGNPVRMVRELEKGGARTLWESEKLRHYEVIFAGDVDGSVSGARDDVYEKPGAKPEVRFSGIMEDLRRRDFSINAIAISLNTQSRGLLLDPTNGLADLEKQEVRALTNHAFTNQPIRLMRILRYCARMNFRMESRTQEWFDLAIERELHKNLHGADVGNEVRSLAREDNPVATLKQWESHEMLAAIHPNLPRRKPDYDSLNKLARMRGNLMESGLRPRLNVPVMYYTLGRLKDREAGAAMRNLELRASEIKEVDELVGHAQKIVQDLKGRKTNAPKDAYFYLSSVLPEMIAFIEVEMPNPKASSKIRNYLQKWRPLRLGLPVGELDALGIPRGPKFDKIIEELFELQLRGRGRDPESRVKILRNLAGIKDEPKKKPEKEKKRKGKDAGVPETKQEKSKGEAAAATPAAGVAKSVSGGEKPAVAAAGASATKAKGKPAKPGAERASAKRAGGAAKPKGRAAKSGRR